LHGEIFRLINYHLKEIKSEESNRFSRILTEIYSK